jgi:hyperosmotically inducible protein
VTYPKYTVFDDVNVTVDAGIVTLSGKVTLAGKKEDIGRRVEQLQGVTSVRNEIDVIPPSAEDDGLRRRVARAIYGSASFWKYASLQSPPIRILVESGHVTLKGSVEREHDRTVAQSLATGHGEASITNELRVVGTARLPD